MFNSIKLFEVVVVGYFCGFCVVFVTRAAIIIVKKTTINCSLTFNIESSFLVSNSFKWWQLLLIFNLLFALDCSF